MKIESLTEAQKARFPEFVKKWTDIGLSTEPANRKESEKGIIEMYKIAGLKKPKIVWCDSPLSQGLTRMIVQKLESDGKLTKKIGASVRASVWDSVRASVMDSVGDSVRASVMDSVRASVMDSVGDSVGASGYGQHDASWLAFYDFFSEVNGLKEETQKLSGIWQVSKNAGWYLPHEKICWASERHSELHRNERGQLHNVRGMALKYPDGWGIYVLNGVRFPEDLFKKVISGTMPFQDILAIVDTDQRTQAMRFGNVWDFVKHANGKKLDEYTKFRQDGSPVRYWLYKFPKGDIFTEEAYYALYDDLVPGSDKQYMSGVEPCMSVMDAMGWKFSTEEDVVTGEQFRLLVPGIHQN